MLPFRNMYPARVEQGTNGTPPGRRVTKQWPYLGAQISLGRSRRLADQAARRRFALETRKRRPAGRLLSRRRRPLWARFVRERQSRLQMEDCFR